MNSVCIYLAEAYTLLFMQLMNASPTVLLIFFFWSKYWCQISSSSTQPLIRIHTRASFDYSYPHINLQFFHKTGLYSNTFETSRAHLMPQTHTTHADIHSVNILSLIFILTWDFHITITAAAALKFTIIKFFTTAPGITCTIAHVIHPIELLLGLLRFIISTFWLLGGRDGVRTSTGELQDWNLIVKPYF